MENQEFLMKMLPLFMIRQVLIVKNIPLPPFNLPCQHCVPFLVLKKAFEEEIIVHKELLMAMLLPVDEFKEEFFFL